MKPTKRSFTIAGHRTSISLEAPFWEALREIAVGEGVSLAALVQRIDHARGGGADAGDGGLSGAIRVYVLRYYRDKARAHLS